MKNWLLGILYRYIHSCIDTYVLKLLLFDFVHFVSIHTLPVSIQKWSLRDRTSSVYRSMLACIDTHLFVLKIQKTQDDLKHACMLRYISVKISRFWYLYRYTPVFVSIQRSKISFLTLVKAFVSIQMIICIDTCMKNYA